MKLKLHVDEYVTAIGAVGIIRLCYQADRYQWADNALTYIDYRDDYLLVDANILTHLPEWYFRSLLLQYSVANREQKKLKYIGSNAKYPNSKVNTNEHLNKLRESVDEQLKKLKKYFSEKEEYKKMEECLNDIKQLKKDLSAEKLVSLRDRYLELLRTPEFEEKLTFNFIRSLVLYKNFFGQVSFLQKAMSHFNFQQHVDKMYEDFIQPLLLDIRLHDILQQEGITEEERKSKLIEHLGQTANRTIYRRWYKELKKLPSEDVVSYFDHQLHCVFENEWLATDNFEEKAYVPLGISSKIFNFSWDLKENSVPISSWIRLVLLLSPIGVTPYTRYVNDQLETFYTFVYCDGTPETVYGDNEALRVLEQNESFEQIIPKIVKREKHKAHQELKAEIQFFEFNSDYKNKWTVLHYYHIPRHMLLYLDSKEARLERIRNRAFRDDFLHLALESVDPMMKIWAYLRNVVDEKATASSAYHALSERLKIKNAKEGKKFMEGHGHIKGMFNEGIKVRDKLIEQSGQRKETTDYVSGGEKRAAGIAYRLLNAAKAGDKKQFLDTVIRLFLQVGLPVPGILLNVLHEEKIDFDSLSGAFITGLLVRGEERSASDESAENPIPSKLYEKGVNS